MCFSFCKQENNEVHNVNDEEGAINSENSDTYGCPEHVDNPFLNRHYKNGILGFRYETKNECFIIYSSIENKTFCYLMRLKPISS